MAFMNFGKKKKVPDELPSLISDEIEKESLDEINTALKEEKKEDSKEEEEKIVANKEREAVQKKKTNDNVVNRLIKGVEGTPVREIVKSTSSDKSFFAEMQEKIVDDLDDVDALEDWYENKVNSGDVVKKMKAYWNSQKKASVLDVMAKSFKEKISKKVSELQKLEKDWQTVYFELVEKEELIKESEAGLREMVSEFMIICKDKKNAMEKDHFEESLSAGNRNKKKKNKKKKKQGLVDGRENEKEKSQEQIEK